MKFFSACTKCLAFLCYDHSVMNLPCETHTSGDNFLTTCSFDDTTSSVENSEITTIFDDSDRNAFPESFLVDGLEKENVIPLPKEVDIKVLAKENRNRGRPYINPKSGKHMPSRRRLGVRCSSCYCVKRGFCCNQFTELQRQGILDAYYDLGDLGNQRHWIKQHVTTTPNNHLDPNSRKHFNFSYSLPGEDLELLPVCRVMFLGTVGISERQVRTTFKKIQEHGHLGSERRGGRQKAMISRDKRLRREIEIHINRFPKMESHYCRKKTSFQYLSAELTLTTMYRLYEQECSQSGREKASESLYRSVFHSQKLKFHVPKKDMCGLCDTYNRGNNAEKVKIQTKYEMHIAEKKAVRQLKEVLKSKAKDDSKFLVASFDLQQVLYVPKSLRGELFYKRKLACYNFTICEIHRMRGFCYFWHEGIARRGANEIASNLYHFLCESDKNDVTEIALFSDGCCGQNKNSILPTMMAHFLDTAKHVSSITLNFFETGHGQNEGDNMHSVVERAVKRVGDIILPTQLATVIRMASRNPYHVKELQTSDVSDWKQLAQERRVLRVRTSEEGEVIDWTKFMSIKLMKVSPGKILYKTSHLQEGFSTINLDLNRRKSNPLSGLLVRTIERPKISEAKYNDLLSFCSGDTPVIFHPEHKAFFEGLPH